jgi:hypothetical protein
MRPFMGTVYTEVRRGKHPWEGPFRLKYSAVERPARSKRYARGWKETPGTSEWEGPPWLKHPAVERPSSSKVVRRRMKETLGTSEWERFSARTPTESRAGLRRRRLRDSMPPARQSATVSGKPTACFSRPSGMRPSSSKHGTAQQQDSRWAPSRPACRSSEPCRHKQHIPEACVY